MKKLNGYLYLIIGFIIGAATCCGIVATADGITATLTTDKVFVNDSQVSAEVYKINGSNYFKLRDLASAVDFSVVYDGNGKRVLIDPSRTYDPNEQYTPSATPMTTPTAIKPLFKDDGASEDAVKDVALMGMYKDGTDGSIGVNMNDTSMNPKVGHTAIKFSYTPTVINDHWSGVALLWEPQGWKINGPDLKAYTKLTFWICGQGGNVKFFTEGDGYSQRTSYVTLTKEWQKITMELYDWWDFVNVPFGWACSQSSPDKNGGTITFWIDGVQFE